MRKRGRPPGSSFSPAIAEEILERLANGETVRGIVRDREDMPTQDLVSQWSADLVTPPIADFANRYARARVAGFDAMADQTLEIADAATNEDAQARKLQVDTRKWLLSKMVPKKYGDRVAIAGDAESPLVVTDLRKLSDAELATLAALAEKAKAAG